MVARPLGRQALVIPRIVLLALLAFVFALGLPGLAAPQSALPPTQPGLGRDEGVFLVTSASDGTQAIYFIAHNVRHSILPPDLQAERQLNPLWPVRAASQQDVLAYPEGVPVGNARSGLVTARVEAAPVEVAAAEPEPTPQPTTYLLRPGDNLTRIAERYGTSVEAILAANGLSNANRIYAGQALVIPPAPASDALAEAPSDATPAAAVAASSSDDAAPQAEEPMPATYTVRRGDSVFTIARQLGVSIDDLLAANGISNPSHVEAGQVLTVPAGSS
jgi:LysM repeat protein